MATNCRWGFRTDDGLHRGPTGESEYYSRARQAVYGICREKGRERRYSGREGRSWRGLLAKRAGAPARFENRFSSDAIIAAFQIKRAFVKIGPAADRRCANNA